MKDIPGYEGIYSITPEGKVWSNERVDSFGRQVKGKWLKPAIHTKGYMQVTLFSDGVRRVQTIHRLVAKTFIPNPKGKLEVNHINGIKLDNRVENLEWATSTDNNRHALFTGLRVAAHGESKSQSKVTESDVVAIRASTGITQRELASMYGVNQQQISRIRRGENWKHV
ncbi:hypothetical protein QT13_01935 [Pectobacterium brasiliense]|uniref:HNH endonuclease n=1 Tax=Pectobacterium brasiliense TaxID=180957 RepID=UPI00057EFC0A|nr:HNH endonuclease [Pectobacterium brasiliense]KHS77025.1 hypothetical protein QT13_01935 [Pectobacterium brasiliense]